MFVYCQRRKYFETGKPCRVRAGAGMMACRLLYSKMSGFACMIYALGKGTDAQHHTTSRLL